MLDHKTLRRARFARIIEATVCVRNSIKIDAADDRIGKTALRCRRSIPDNERRLK